jgi:hypothetical protein
MSLPQSILSETQSTSKTLDNRNAYETCEVTQLISQLKTLFFYEDP